MRVVRVIQKIFYIFIILLGLTIMSYPDINAYLLNRENEEIIDAFNDANFSDDEDADDTASSDDGDDSDSLVYAPAGTEEMLEKVQAYNEELYETGQAAFRDAWATTQAPAAISGLDDDLFGYIEIPKMDVTLPMYVGATNAKMAKGAVILGATSLPIGGENTNSVIAAHRGYQGIPFFREIEKLEIGDGVIITNPWGKIGYRVESIDVINPNDSDKVKLQEGKDMITLMTCHPYRSHGKYRYVVYCIRDDSVIGEEVSDAPEVSETIVSSDGAIYLSSQEDIDTEQMFRRWCAIGLAIFFVLCMIPVRKRKLSDETRPGAFYFGYRKRRKRRKKAKPPSEISY